MHPASGAKLIAGSIIAAGIIIAGSIFFTGSTTPSGNLAANLGQPSDDPYIPEANDDIVVAAVTEDDHVKGDFDAPVTIIEYSDLECPFCARVHPTLEQVVADYDGDVRWVYRHFPLTQIHPNATRAAEAAECAAEQDGDAGFWAIVDGIFEAASPDLSADGLVALAEAAGLNGGAIESCLDEGTYASYVADETAKAAAAGAQGTPYSVIMDAEGSTTPVSGALPYENWTAIIDELL